MAPFLISCDCKTRLVKLLYFLKKGLGMEFVYKYSGKNSYEDAISGMIIANNENDAKDKLVHLGIRPIIIECDINISFAIIGELSLEEYYRFYSFVSKIIKNGASPASSLEDYIELIDSVRMKCMLSTVLACLRAGISMSYAMERAGFPTPHYMTIRALEETSETADAFARLSEECKDQHALKQAIAAMMRKPKGFFSVFAIAFYGYLGFLLNITMKGLTNIVGEDKLPAYSLALGNLSKLCNENIVLFTILYWGGIASIIIFLKSNAFRKLLLKVPTINLLTERIDMYNGWSSFGTLNSSGVSNSLSCDLISKSMFREDTASMFLIMRSALSSGEGIPGAVKKAGFPNYIYKKIKAIDLQGGDSGELIVDMAKEIREHVTFVVDKLKERLNFIILIATSIAVLVFFLLTYYPILMATISQV